MMLFKQRYLSPVAFLIIFTFIDHSYQQTARSRTDEFCIQNHTMSHTLQTFWHDAHNDCELESKRLIELYSQLLDSSNVQHDQCSALLRHQLRKKLINILSSQLEESFIMQSITNDIQLKRNLQQLQQIDERVAQIVWERAINEVFLFVKPEEILNEIILLKEHQIQIVALQSLLNKYMQLNDQESETLLPYLTYQIHLLYEGKTATTSVANNLERLYQRLPKALRSLFESSKQNIGLLNYQHFEYLYAPRDNGPDADRRVALTWSQTKNSTDSDGHFTVSFNEKGSVAFGNRFGASTKFLYADVEQQAPYFWIGTGLKSSQWWQVIWPHATFHSEVAGYILLRNEESKGLLLCATREYDENRRYVTLLNANQNIKNPACFWLVTKF